MVPIKRIVLFGFVLLMITGCHEPGGHEKSSGNGGSASSPPPVKKDGSGSVSHSFVPYADKPPLGTPVETH